MSDHAIGRYLAALDAGDSTACAACFAEDAIYLHPSSNRQTDDRLFALRGRAQIRAWLDRRGRNSTYHRVVFAAMQGTSVFVEGRAGGADLRAATFAAHAILDKNGLIKRYIAFVEYPDKDAVADECIAFDDATTSTYPDQGSNS